MSLVNPNVLFSLLVFQELRSRQSTAVGSLISDFDENGRSSEPISEISTPSKWHAEDLATVGETLQATRRADTCQALLYFLKMQLYSSTCAKLAYQMFEKRALNAANEH